MYFCSRTHVFVFIHVKAMSVGCECNTHSRLPVSDTENGFKPALRVYPSHTEASTSGLEAG